MTFTGDLPRRKAVSHPQNQRAPTVSVTDAVMTPDVTHPIPGTQLSTSARIASTALTVP